jgi:hypothetical protein
LPNQRILDAVQSPEDFVDIFFESEQLNLYRIDWFTLKGVLVAQDGKSSLDQFPKSINIYKQSQCTLQNPHLGFTPSHRVLRCRQTYKLIIIPINNNGISTRPHRQLQLFSLDN